MGSRAERDPLGGQVRGGEGTAPRVAAIRRDSDIVDPDWDLVEAAAQIKAVGGLAYADAFCIATAGRLGVSVWAGDPEIIESASSLPCDVVDLR